jgi:hypothetical protein
VVVCTQTGGSGPSALLSFLATVDGLRSRLRDERSLLPKMIDECLRVESPVVAVARTARGSALEFDCGLPSTVERRGMTRGIESLPVQLR